MKSNQEFIQGIYERHHQHQRETISSKKTAFLKIAVISFLSIIAISGIGYLGVQAYQKLFSRAKLQPTFVGDPIDKNSVWVGTFQLAWNEFTDMLGNPVQFEDGNTKLVDQLNQKSFTKDMLSSDSYYLKVDQTSENLKEEIEKELQDKFHKQSTLLGRVNWQIPSSNSYILYSALNKEFTFLSPFDRIAPYKFSNSEENVEYFGIINSSSEELNKNVQIAFYQEDPDNPYGKGKEFGIRLATKEGEEVLLYKAESLSKSFEELYQEFLQKEKSYTKSHTFRENDELSIPCIHVEADINYEELCGKEIKGEKGRYILNAVQNVNFNLNEEGGKLLSEAAIQDMFLSASLESPRLCYFTDSFVLFLKEKDKDKPYFAISITNTNFLLPAKNLEEYEFKIH